VGGIRQGRLLPAGQPDRDRGLEPPRPARPTELGWDLDAYARRVEAFGCRAIPIDGHDLGEIDKARTQAAGADRPTVILARPRKGRALSEAEDREGWHGRPLPAEMAEQAIVELGGARHLTVRGPLPEGGSLRARPSGEVTLPRYELGAKVATRKAFGESLAVVGARSDVVALVGEVDNFTHGGGFRQGVSRALFRDVHRRAAAHRGRRRHVRARLRPVRRHLCGVFTRACDFIRMSAISAANIRLCGSHAGVEIGADGPSQMALEDLAMMRAVHGSTVLYPSDVTSTAYPVREMAERSGVVYMRTTRGAYPVLYGLDETFPVGGAKVVRSSPDDQVTLAGAGVTLHHCLAAAGQLGQDGIRARVLDLYSVKPIDMQTLVAAANATRSRVVVIEDHYPAGGIGSAVLEALSDADHPARIAQLPVQGLPGSGTSAELMEAAGTPAARVAQAARELLDA